MLLLLKHVCLHLKTTLFAQNWSDFISEIIKYLPSIINSEEFSLKQKNIILLLKNMNNIFYFLLVITAFDFIENYF